MISGAIFCGRAPGFSVFAAAASECLIQGHKSITLIAGQGREIRGNPGQIVWKLLL